MNFGHYTAYIKVKNKKWFCFDDNNVNEINVKTNDAYCLFYIKKK